MRSSLLASLALALCWTCIPRHAYAYIDPGTGSFIFQMLIAGLLGALVTMKMWYGAFKVFLRKHFGKAQTTPALATESGAGADVPAPADKGDRT